MVRLRKSDGIAKLGTMIWATLPFDTPVRTLSKNDSPQWLIPVPYLAVVCLVSSPLLKTWQCSFRFPFDPKVI